MQKVFTHRPKLSLFILALLARLVFGAVTKFDHYSFAFDGKRYDRLSNQILEGNWNFDVTAYIISPLYPMYLAFFKGIFGQTLGLELAMIGQILLISLSAVWLYYIALLLWSNQGVALLAGLVYALYPMTMFHNWQNAQESLFQPLMIGFLYAYLRVWQDHDSVKKSIIAGLLLTLAFMTKSHVLLATPFMFLCHLWLSRSQGLAPLKSIAIIGSVCIFLSLPWSIYNYQKHDVVMVSSYGIKSHFRFGNDWSYYYNVVDQSKIEVENATVLFDKNYSDPKYGFINRNPIKLRSQMHFNLALNWIETNPEKFLYLKWVNFYKFFTPGVSRGYHVNLIWLSSFLSSLPIFVFGWWGIFRLYKENYKLHLFICPAFLSILIYYVLFAAQSRFRSVTIEPILIIYAAWQCVSLYDQWKRKSSYLST